PRPPRRTHPARPTERQARACDRGAGLAGGRGDGPGAAAPVLASERVTSDGDAYRARILEYGRCDAIRERHDREVRVDLERVREQARVRDAEPRYAVHAAVRIRDGVRGGATHAAAAHEMCSGYRRRARHEPALVDARVDIRDFVA